MDLWKQLWTCGPKDEECLSALRLDFGLDQRIFLTWCHQKVIQYSEIPDTKDYDDICIAYVINRLPGKMR